MIGAGLAGAEAAWQAAQHGARVTLYEMRPGHTTPAHETGWMAELVCSNSLGSNLSDRALGLLKNELRRLGSLIIACADRTAVPAGGALAVDRTAFSQAVTQAIENQPNITVLREEVTDLAPLLSPPGAGSARALAGQGAGGRCTIVATGPLTSPPLAEAIRRLAGQDYLAFFDAMAPIVTAESVNMEVAWRANRWERRSRDVEGQGGDKLAAAGSPAQQAGDYINCPLDREQYDAFVEAVNRAERISLRGFEQDEAARRYFEACLPIEVLAGRDPNALAFGPMTPMGLWDPRTGRRPYAAVQLRRDNVAGTLYNLVGFQTNLRWDDQARVLRMIPCLERAEFVRLGQMHRNTFINSQALLRPTLQWHDREDLFFAGQITGTEGYVGSTAGGLLAGINAVRVAKSFSPLVLPPTTMMGALFHYIARPVAAAGAREPAPSFQPMKANFGLLPDLNPLVPDKRRRHEAYAGRALADLEALLSSLTDVGSSRFL